MQLSTSTVSKTGLILKMTINACSLYSRISNESLFLIPFLAVPEDQAHCKETKPHRAKKATEITFVLS